MATSSRKCRLFWPFDVHYFHAIHECRNGHFHSSHYFGEDFYSVTCETLKRFYTKHISSHGTHFTQSRRRRQSVKQRRPFTHPWAGFFTFRHAFILLEKLFQPRFQAMIPLALLIFPMFCALVAVLALVGGPCETVTIWSAKSVTIQCRFRSVFCSCHFTHWRILWFS